MFYQNKFLPEAILQQHCGSLRSLALPMTIVIGLKKCQYPEHVYLPSRNAVWTSQTLLCSAVEEGLAKHIPK